MSAKAKPAKARSRRATRAEIDARDAAVQRFIEMAETVAAGSGSLTLAPKAREIIAEAAAEILRLWVALDVALEALDASKKALEEIERIKEEA